MHDFIYYLIYLLREGMDLVFLAAAGCAVVLGAVYLLLRRQGRTFPWGKALALLALCGYLAMLGFVTLMRLDSVAGAGEVNLHLFRAWREAWNAWTLQVWLNVLLNVAVFVPLGLLLPLVGRWFRVWYHTLPVGLGLSLLIETAQYFTRQGCFDVDDLLTNTLGCALGYGLVMAGLFLVHRGPGTGRRVLTALALPLGFLAVLAGIWGSYHLKPYGNFVNAPAFRADTKGVQWELQGTLSKKAETVPIYQIDPPSVKEADAFMEEFAAQRGIEFPDVSYYDESAMYMNHSTGDFLRVIFQDGSWEYRVGRSAEDWGRERLTECTEAEVRSLLQEEGFPIPETAEFSEEESGWYSFTVNQMPDGDAVLDGTFRCQILDGVLLGEVENRLLRYTPVGEETVISPQAAYERLRQGRFSPGDFVEYWAPQEIQVDSWALSYQVDSKGFYRPLYAFQSRFGEEGFPLMVLAD